MPGEAYFLFHGLRLAREWRRARNAAREAARPLPGDNPGRLTAADVAMHDAVTREIQAEQRRLKRAWGEHPYVRATPANDPDWANTVELLNPRNPRDHRCLTCKGYDDGVVHQPTWPRYPGGAEKPGPVCLRNALMKELGMGEAEAAAWVSAYDADLERGGTVAEDRDWGLVTFVRWRARLADPKMPPVASVPTPKRRRAAKPAV